MQNDTGTEPDLDGPPPAKRARTTKQASWDDYKNDIYQFYAVQNYSIEDLMSVMSERGLHASRRTYMKRIGEWGFNKKIRRAEKEQMLRIERDRSAIGKRTTFRIRGQEVTSAKLRRAAPMADELGPAPETAPETPSDISYGTPVSTDDVDSDVDGDVDADATTDDTPVYTPNWAMDPAEHFWRHRKARSNDSTMIRDVRPSPVSMSSSYESAVVRLFAPKDHDDSFFREIEMEPIEFDITEIEPATATSFFRPFSLRRFLTSTMLTLNFDFVRTTQQFIAPGPYASANVLPAAERDVGLYYASARQNQEQLLSAAPGLATPSSTDDASEESLNHHLALFKAGSAESGEDEDDVHHRNFSNVLGVLKCRYDREAATLSLMGIVFGDSDLATEDEARDKVEALIERRSRVQGFEHPDTLEACLAGLIFLLDATRLDAEQNTWLQTTVYARLRRARMLIHRIFAAHLQEETVKELLGDDEAHELEPPLDPEDRTGMKRGVRLMTDIVEQTVCSLTVLHTLELLPRYHKLWAEYHWHEREESLRQRPKRFTM